MSCNAPFAHQCASCALLSDPLKCIILFLIKGLDDLRHNLAKAEVASSSLAKRDAEELSETREARPRFEPII